MACYGKQPLIINFWTVNNSPLEYFISLEFFQIVFFACNDKSKSVRPKNTDDQTSSLPLFL